ncbi:hypothetical protein GQ457_13G021550 [Hibiscus cannabinus]
MKTPLPHIFPFLPNWFFKKLLTPDAIVVGRHFFYDRSGEPQPQPWSTTLPPSFLVFPETDPKSHENGL